MRMLANDATVAPMSVTASPLSGVSASAKIFDPGANAFLSQCHLGVLEDPSLFKYSPNTPSRSRGSNAAEHLAQDPLVCKLRLILNRFNGLESLQENWDSNGSRPPAIEAVSAAQNLIWNVIASYDGESLDQAIPFTAVPLSGEGVQVEWHGANRAIEVEVSPQGRFSYLLTTGQPEHGESEERNNLSQEEIMRLISTVIA